MAVDEGAARFFDGIRAQEHPAFVAVRDGQVMIRPTDGARAQEWPLATLTAKAAPGGEMMFSQGRHPARLIIADPALLECLRLKSRKWPKRQAGWGVALAACTAVLALTAGLVATLPSLLAPLIPPVWEATLGRGAEAALLAQHPPCKGAAGQAALDRFVQRIAAAAGIAAPIHLAVADNALVNAFTLPGNRIVVMHGLIAASTDGAELAGVLAHEMGHVAHHDPARALLRQLGLRVIAAGLGLGGASGGNVATALLGLSYGRSAETSADAFAIATLHAAGLRADGLGRFFAQTAADGAPVPAFLSDHPATAEREVRARQPPDGAEPFDAVAWQAIRAMCRA